MFDRLHGSSVVVRVLRPEDVAPWNPESFLKHVWPHAPDGQRILIFTLPDKSSWWFQSAKAAAECVAGIKDRNVYVGIGLAGRDYGPTRRCLSDEITGLCGFVVDLDMISEAHKGKPLPESIEPAVSILPFEMPPTFVILTGNGLQVWYFFNEPYIFSGPDDRTDIARLSRRFHKMLQLTASSRSAFTKQQLLSVQPGTADQDLSDRSSFSTVHVSEEGAPTSSQQEQGNGDQAEEKTPTDPALAKAELCSRISDLLGVRILRIAKIPGKEPQYPMELENAKIEFACVGDLISQERVRTKIAGAVDYLPRKLPSKVWESLAQLMLSACTVESTTEKTDWTGSTRMFLRQYLSDAIFIDSVDGQLEQNVRKPMVLDGQTSICATEFRNHINNMFRRLRLLLCAAAVGYRYDR
jgi:hypothetical protein